MVFAVSACLPAVRCLCLRHIPCCGGGQYLRCPLWDPPGQDCPERGRGAVAFDGTNFCIGQASADSSALVRTVRGLIAHHLTDLEYETKIDFNADMPINCTLASAVIPQIPLLEGKRAVTLTDQKSAEVAGIRTYAASQGKNNRTYAEELLPGAHGVVWDDTLGVLWGLGHTQVCAYRIGGTDNYPAITEVESLRSGLPCKADTISGLIPPILR